MLLVAHVWALYEGAGTALAAGGIDVVERADGKCVPDVRGRGPVTLRQLTVGPQIMTLVTSVTKATR